MNDRYLKSSEVRELLGGISNTTLWRRIKDGSIPTPIKLGGGTTNFFKESWIKEIIEA
jgi:predicted DNA-binding transcriptional regulator AlpA